MSEADVATSGGLDADVDDLLDAVASSRRRDVLSYLQQLDDDVTDLSRLAEGVPARAAGRTDERPDEVAIALHHVHLPKLDDCGLLDYDARNGTVRYHRHPDREARVALALELAGGLS